MDAEPESHLNPEDDFPRVLPGPERQTGVAAWARGRLRTGERLAEVVLAEGMEMNSEELGAAPASRIGRSLKAAGFRCQPRGGRSTGRCVFCAGPLYAR